MCLKPLLNPLTAGLYKAVWDTLGPEHRVTQQLVVA